MKERESYLVVTIRPWNISAFEEIISHYPGKWSLITKPENFTLQAVQSLRPRYIFFPHWSEKIPRKIHESYECIGFHETDLPYGRGGSPIQNLIIRGHEETLVSAFRVTDEVDTGPIYLKRPLSLGGRAEDIYGRCSRIVAEMIGEIVESSLLPRPQDGVVSEFKRRTPEESNVNSCETLSAFYNLVRMLDAPEYPKAFFETEGFRFEFDRAELCDGAVKARVTVKRRDAEDREENE